MPGNVLIKKPETFYCSIGCKKGLSRHLNFRKRNIEFTPDKTHASCAGFADRLVGKHRTLVAYNVLSWLKVHKYWSKKYLNCRELNSFRVDLHYLLEGKVPKLLEYAYCLNVANSAFWQVFLFNNDDFLVSKMGSMTIHSFNKYSNRKENAITIRLWNTVSEGRFSFKSQFINVSMALRVYELMKFC